MSQPQDLAARVATLEAEMRIVRQEAAAARALAAGADRDVADYRAEMRSQTQVISALRQDHVALREEMREGFNELGAGLTKISALLAHLVDTQHPDADPQD